MVKIGMSQPHSIKLNIKLPLNKSEFVAHSINTGVPHVVVFVKDLQGTDVTSLGNKIRNHREFSPQGTNADFVRVVGKDNIAVRTYERGVEAETLACGTGCVASALIYVLETCANKPAAGLRQIDVATRSGEVLKVFFDINGKEFSNVSLEGNAKIVYKGSFVPRPKTPAR
jgi:diaminopimelate epimerase